MVVVGQEISQKAGGVSFVFGADKNFNTIASGNDQSLQDSLALDEIRQGGAEARFLDVHPLTHFDGRGAMVHSYEQKVHGKRRGWGLGIKGWGKTGPNPESRTPNPIGVNRVSTCFPRPMPYGKLPSCGIYPCCPLKKLIPRNVTIMAANPRMATYAARRPRQVPLRRVENRTR